MGKTPIPILQQFSDEQKNHIMILYNSGKTHEEIATEHNVPRRTIMKLCIKLGLHKSHAEAQKSRLDPYFVDKVVDMRKSGKTIQEIASETGRSISAVGRICNSSNLHRPAIEFGDIKTEYESGMSMADLAAKYKTNQYIISKKMDELGIKKRPPRVVMDNYQHQHMSQKREMPELPIFEDSATWFKMAYIDKRCSLTQLAEFTNKSIGYVSGKLSKYGIQVRSISEGVRRLDPKTIVEAYQKLGSMSKVADVFNCTITAISKILESNGVVPTSVSEMFSGDGNPFFGKSHPDDVREKCAEIGSFYGAKFWSENPEYVEVVREKQKLLWSDLERRRKDSEFVSKLRKDGKLGSRKGFIDSRFGRLAFDSSWEANLIELCEKDNRVISLERDFDLIEYDFDGQRHFVPDFRIWLSNGEFLVVEVKSNWLALQAKEQAKIAAAYGNLFEKFFVVDNKNLFEVTDRISLSFSPMEFDFDDLVLREVVSDDYVRFYGLFHYLGRTGRYGFTLGAYLCDKLIAVATISSISRNEIAERLGKSASEVRELVRFCIHPDFHKKNFGSWFLTRVVDSYSNKNQDISMLVSFADTTQGHFGTIYKASGWLEDGMTGSNYHYVDREGFKIHKKTVYDRAKAIGITESAFVAESGYNKVFEFPKVRFIKNLDRR